MALPRLGRSHGQKNHVPEKTVIMLKMMLLVGFLAFLVACKKPPVPKEKSYTYPQVKDFTPTITDNFYYLGDPANIKDLQNYAKQENDYAEDSVYDSKLTDITSDDIDTFVKPFYDSVNDLGGRIGGYFYSRTTGEFNLWKREDLVTKVTTTIIDEEKIWKSLGSPDYFHIGRVIPSPNGTYVAYTVDTVGKESYTVYVQELDSNKILGGKIGNVNKGFVWSPNEKYLLYEENGIESKHTISIKSHKVGDDPDNDLPILSVNYTFELQLRLTSDNQFITITKKNYRDGCQVFYLERSQFTDQQADFLEFNIDGMKDSSEYYIEHGNFQDSQTFIAIYQKSGFLSNFGVYEVKQGGTPEEFSISKTILSENGERYVMRADCMNTLIYVQYYDTKRMNCYVMQLNPALAKPEESLVRIPFGDFLGPHRAVDPFFGDDYPILGTNLGSWKSSFTPTDDYQVIVSSLRSPPITMIYNNQKKSRDIVKNAKTISGYNPDYYRDLFIETTNEVTNFTDGGIGVHNVSVAISWVGKNKKDDGKKKAKYYALTGNGRSTILTHDSVYGKIVQPRFNPWMLPLMERGFLYGYIHARGSRNRGTYWHRVAQTNRMYSDYDVRDSIRELIDLNYAEDGTQILLYSKGAAAISMVNLMIGDRNLYNLSLMENPYVAVMSKLLQENEGALDRTEFGDVLNDERMYRFWDLYDPYFWFTNKKANYPNIYIYGGTQDAEYYGNAGKWMAQLRYWELQNDNTYVMRYYDNTGFLGPLPNFDNMKAIMTDVHSFSVKLIQGYVWHDPLEWLWILLCILVLAIWMICFMALFICCELRSKKKEKKAKEKKEKEEAEKAKKGVEVEGEGEDGKGVEEGNYGTNQNFESADFHEDGPITGTEDAVGIGGYEVPEGEKEKSTFIYAEDGSMPPVEETAMGDDLMDGGGDEIPSQMHDDEEPKDF